MRAGGRACSKQTPGGVGAAQTVTAPSVSPTHCPAGLRDRQVWVSLFCSESHLRIYDPFTSPGSQNGQLRAQPPPPVPACLRELPEGDLGSVGRFSVPRVQAPAAPSPWQPPVPIISAATPPPGSALLLARTRPTDTPLFSCSLDHSGASHPAASVGVPCAPSPALLREDPRAEALKAGFCAHAAAGGPGESLSTGPRADSGQGGLPAGRGPTGSSVALPVVAVASCHAGQGARGAEQLMAAAPKCGTFGCGCVCVSGGTHVCVCVCCQCILGFASV